MLIIIPFKHLLELMTHHPWRHTFRPPDSPKFLQRHRMLLMPLQNSFKIPTLMVDAEVRECVLLGIGPEMRIHIDVARAHEVLQQRVHAVTDMQLVVPIHAFLAIIVVEVPVQVLAQTVEAVDLVEDVYAPDVGVWTKAERFGPFGGLRGVFALVEDVLAGDGYGGLRFDAFPGRINFWGWSLAKYGFGMLLDERAVESFRG